MWWSTLSNLTVRVNSSNHYVDKITLSCSNSASHTYALVFDITNIIPQNVKIVGLSAETKATKVSTISSTSTTLSIYDTLNSKSIKSVHNFISTEDYTINITENDILSQNSNNLIVNNETSDLQVWVEGKLTSDTDALIYDYYPIQISYRW
jgi:hypothetical protein